MTDTPSKAAIERAMELTSQKWAEHEVPLTYSSGMLQAFARYIDAHPEPQEGWQGIESAPKNQHPGPLGICVALIEGTRWAFHHAWWDDQQEMWTDVCSDRFLYPTHWQPLPAPPTNAAPANPPAQHSNRRSKMGEYICPRCGNDETTTREAGCGQGLSAPHWFEGARMNGCPMLIKSRFRRFLFDQFRIMP